MAKLTKQEKQLKKEKIKENKKYINNKTINRDYPKTSQLNENVILEARDVKKIIANQDKRYDIVKGVNLDIYFKEFVMIFGESGSGKTSLISILSGLERPSEGNVNINTFNTSPLNQSQLTKLRHQEIGYIFQQYGLLKDLTVLENVLITLDSDEQNRIIKKNKEYLKKDKHLRNKYKYLSNYLPHSFITNCLDWLIQSTYNYNGLLYLSHNYIHCFTNDQVDYLCKYIYEANDVYDFSTGGNYQFINDNLDFDYWAYLNYKFVIPIVSIDYEIKNDLKNIFNTLLDDLRDYCFDGEFIYEVLKGLEINKLINKKSLFLSGGQQQRVSISRAVAKKPHILFADEPTGAVDSNTAKLIMKLFVKLNTEYDTTIIMVTHNSNLSCMATRNITIADGLIVNDEYNQEIKTVDEVNFE